MSFLTQVEDLIGTQSDTTLINDLLSQSARKILDTLADRGSDKIQLYATDKTDSGSGVDITNGRAISAHKAGYPARRVPSEMKSMLTDSDSIHYAIATDPAWYIEVTKGYVKPGGGTIRHIGYPLNIDSTTAVTISNFPPSALRAVIYDTAVQALFRNITDILRTTINGLTYNAPANAVPPSSPSFTYTDATGAVIALSNVSMSQILTFTPPVFGGNFTNIDTALSNQDIELASGHGQKLGVQLNQYATDLQNQLADFNKQAKQFDNDLQKAIAQAQIDAQRASQQAQLEQDLSIQNEIQTVRTSIEQYSASLGKYAQDVQDFAAQVNEEISRLQTLIQKNVQEYQGLAGVQAGLITEFNKLMENL